MTDFTSLRTAMVNCQVRPSDVTKFPIIKAMLDTRREVFVPDAKRDVAYAGEHVDLGHRRVVLDPRVFGKMLEAVDIGPTDLVLDIGCALGYSTAVMAHMAEAVVAVEQDPDMAAEAEVNLADEAVDNAVVVPADLAKGAGQHGPYDAIVINGAIEVMPDDILAQLKDGGRIVAIFLTGSAGKCRLGLNASGRVTWRNKFDATAPVLPGFERIAEFAL